MTKRWYLDLNGKNKLHKGAGFEYRMMARNKNKCLKKKRYQDNENLPDDGIFHATDQVTRQFCGPAYPLTQLLSSLTQLVDSDRNGERY